MSKALFVGFKFLLIWEFTVTTAVSNLGLLSALADY